MDHQRSIFYIEDDLEMIELVKLILTRRGYLFNSACNGQTGIEAVKKEKPDLILLDLMMPEIDGWTVFQQLRTDSVTQDIPVIIVTAKSQSIDRVLGLHIAKVNDFLSKPFHPQELIESIEKVLKS